MLATTRPLAGVVGHGLATCKGRPIAAKAPLLRGDMLWPGPLQGAVARRGSSPQGAATREHNRLRLARKGLPPTDSPAASRGGSADRRGGRPLAGWLPATKGSRCLRRGSDGGVVRVKEG
ncbi:hypothetical protein BHM03_00055648 [Ensete ventricosum]|nr:hypothetical protein BHM03_00055648 [Ensete ventricosum]